jgi:hypothetical protein
VRALIDDVKASPARRLVVVYAALVVLVGVVAALPGNPDFSGRWGFFVAVTVQTLIVRSLWRGGGFGWLFAFAMAVLAPVSVALMGGSPDTGTTVFILVSAVQAAVLALLFVSSLRDVAPSA